METGTIKEVQVCSENESPEVLLVCVQEHSWYVCRNTLQLSALLRAGNLNIPVKTQVSSLTPEAEPRSVG